jgi:hypothetical protein
MPLSKINLGIAFSVKCLFSKLQKYLLLLSPSTFHFAFVLRKLIIRSRTISYSSFKKKERDKRENDLENTLQKLQLGQENNIEELNRVESELKKGLFSSKNMKWLSLTTVPLLVYNAS